jgi:hypothetical protein
MNTRRNLTAACRFSALLLALQFSGCDSRPPSISESKSTPESATSLASLAPLETLGEDPEVIIPEDSGYVDVTKPPYNAKGDGVTDDTKAIQQAIFDGKPLRGGRGGQAVVFLPAGTYRVTNTLGWYQVDGTHKAYVALVGAGRGKTLIRLADAAPGFTEAAKPKPVIQTNNSTNTANAPLWTPNTGNEAFANYITDLTVDTGLGNPGAVGIDFIGHNLNGIERVTIRSTDEKEPALKGLSLEREVGPSLFSRVEVIGFKKGVSIKSYGYYPTTFERLFLRGQREVGVSVDNANVIFRKLISQLSVPAVQQTGSTSLMVMLDSDLRGENPAVPAIQASDALDIRDVSSSGYSRLLSHSVAKAPDANALASFQHPAPPVPPPARLPVRETPAAFEAPVAEWANVRKFGAVADGKTDDAPAFQRALDSGAAVVYIPRAIYRLSQTLTVPETVRRIEGFASILLAERPSGFSGDSMLKVSSGAETLSIRELGFERTPNSLTAILHTAPRALVLRNAAQVSYVGQTGAGELFAEGFNSDAFVRRALTLAPGQSAWIRQLNIECRTAEPLDDMVLNAGAKLWVLGIKAEMPTVLIRTVGGGVTETMGGWIDPVIYPGNDLSAFYVRDADLRLSLVSHQHNGGYRNIVENTTGGERRLLKAADLPDRGRMPGRVGEEVFVVGRQVGLVYSESADTEALVSLNAVRASTGAGEPPLRLRVERQGKSLAEPLTVALSSRLPASEALQARVALPEAVVIPAGEKSAEFDVPLVSAPGESPQAVAVQIGPSEGYRLGYPAEVNLTALPTAVPLVLKNATVGIALDAAQPDLGVDAGSGGVHALGLRDGSGNGIATNVYPPLAPVWEPGDEQTPPGLRIAEVGSLSIAASEKIGGIRGRDAAGNPLLIENARNWGFAFTVGAKTDGVQVIYKQGNQRSGLSLSIIDGKLNAYLIGEALSGDTISPQAWVLHGQAPVEPGSRHSLIISYDPKAKRAEAWLDGKEWASTEARTLEKHAVGFDTELGGVYCYGAFWRLPIARIPGFDANRKFWFRMGYGFNGIIHRLAVADGVLDDADFGTFSGWLVRNW